MRALEFSYKSCILTAESSPISSMLTIADKLHTTVLYALDSVAIVANFVLIYAIFTRTPRTLRSYAILLLNMTFVDIVSASCSAFAIARLIYLPEGPSQLYLYRARRLDCVSAICAIYARLFRDKYVNVSVPSIRVTILISVLLYAPIGFVMFMFHSSFELPPSAILRKLHLDYPATWHPNVTDYRFSISLAILILLSPVAMIIIFIVRRILLNEIKKMVNSKNVNSLTKELQTWKARDHHSHIAMALSYQLLLPVGQTLACFTWLLSVAGLWSGEASERLVMTVMPFRQHSLKIYALVRQLPRGRFTSHQSHFSPAVSKNVWQKDIGACYWFCVCEHV
ncbi:hypothetical protein PRIPAC_97319 [Pristionchus pacificus]|uniref:G protein-coupled receptor n=1 Tax=Pristionchus pacificus TaxID=54126 RepID=A0A2A6D2L2_PRIPA|nr:hypothetical protein PRIPAC_97319 [Pristionchus pacificus]|eukprot:PDM84712.1 G protein-coupled receptor [Pristionchus pacificus]